MCRRLCGYGKMYHEAEQYRRKQSGKQGTAGKAESMSEFPDVNISKQKILLLLRDNKQKDAVTEVNQYIKLLNDIHQAPHSEDDEQWLTKEYHWANTLLKQLYIL